MKESTEEAKAEESQTEESQTEESQTEKSQTEESQTEESQTEKSQTEKSQIGESQIEESQTEKSQTEESQIEESQIEKSQTENLQTEKLQAEKMYGEENQSSEKSPVQPPEKLPIAQKKHTGLYGAGLLWVGLLLVWTKFMQTAAQLCMYGAVRRHLPILMLCGAIILVWFLLWTLGYFLILKPILRKKITGKWIMMFKLFFAAELMAFILITAFYGRQIAGSAMHYSGKLAWEIDSLLNWKNVSLKHNNVYTDGAGGIFDDLDQKMDLPDDLYIINRFMIQYDQDGKITGIDGFFCGKSKNGQEKTWLLTYNGKGSMKVRESEADAADAAYLTKERRIKPMLEIIRAADLKKDTLAMIQKYPEDSFELLYYGYRNAGADGIVPVLGESAGFSDGLYLGNTSGYEVSLSIPGKEDTIIPVRYLDTRP